MFVSGDRRTAFTSWFSSSGHTDTSQTKVRELKNMLCGNVSAMKVRSLPNEIAVMACFHIPCMCPSPYPSLLKLHIGCWTHSVRQALFTCTDNDAVKKLSCMATYQDVHIWTVNWAKWIWDPFSLSTIDTMLNVKTGKISVLVRVSKASKPRSYIIIDLKTVTLYLVDTVLGRLNEEMLFFPQTDVVCTWTLLWHGFAPDR